jgi:hypothetical protein
MAWLCSRLLWKCPIYLEGASHCASTMHIDMENTCYEARSSAAA